MCGLMSFLVGRPPWAHSHVVKAIGPLALVAGWLKAGGAGFPRATKP